MNTHIEQITYDEYEIAMNKAQELLEAGIVDTEDEGFQTSIGDYDLMAWEYEDFKDRFRDILKTISPDGKFHVEGRNMGWRNLSGHADIQADTPESFMSQTFPHTSDWTFRGTFDHQTNILEYRICHHDSPTGERYTVFGN